MDQTQYRSQKGILYYIIDTPQGCKAKPFMLCQSRLILLHIFHDEQCHIETDKAINAIKKHFLFPILRNFVRNYIKYCLICAVKKTRSEPLQGFVTNIEKPLEPMNTLHVDCLGPLHTY